MKERLDVLWWTQRVVELDGVLKLSDLALACLNYVRAELEDDPSQDQPGCALYPMILALRRAGYLEPQEGKDAEGLTRG